MPRVTEENPSFVLKAVKEVSLENIPCPKIEDPYDVIVNIAQTGICGFGFPSDMYNEMPER